MKKNMPPPKPSAWKTFWENLAHRKRTDRSFYATLLAVQFFIVLVVLGVVLFFLWQSSQTGPRRSVSVLDFLN